MTENDKSSIRINAGGVNSKVAFNVGPGSSVKMGADNIQMTGVEQNSFGGDISHRAGDLTQVGGNQYATNGGSISNTVESGTLLQQDLDQRAHNDGKIINEVKKN